MWNRIPDSVQRQLVKLALDHPEKSPRELAWHFTDRERYFVSESSVFRILKGFDRIENPAFEVVRAAKRFKKPTTRPNQLWQTDFTYSSLWAGAGTTCPRSWTISRATSWRGS